MSIAGANDPNNAVCKACKTTVQDQAHSIIVKATDLIEGLCLDCVQAPEGQGKDCRVRHGDGIQGIKGPQMNERMCTDMARLGTGIVRLDRL